MADMSVSAKPAVKVRFYRLRNRLKEKTVGLGRPIDEPSYIDEKALEAAQRIFEEMSEDYPDWVNGQISSLYELHRRCVDSPEQRRGLFEQITRLAHDLKGQGGTFGYPLVTAFSTSLNRFSAIRQDINDNHVEIIKAHIDAMRAVIRDRIKGDGGEIGAALQRGLEQVIAKYR
ncbi:Hpt domain-containing protein [Pedomonas mirosovicensis]|uniref:Hpt domain-containing protein n=1 Tax=Pedomonas mirosovicensis TaxID=2908641 RepID=UPI00216A7203|nr:Hpt domain-containing protein [Pedomonas mirosovicensis]MCH8685484.1 Hpt domain-containing protein [Pedomonas mirosovicensis]